MTEAAIFLAGGQDTLILSVALIGALGLGAQWLAWRIQAPAIVLMALAGLAVGPLWAALTGEPLLDPDAEFGDLLRPIISLAVAVILFEGGLVLKFDNLRDAGRAVRRMVFLGGPLAWVFGSLAAHYAAGLDWASSIVFAGVMVVTGPTVIMPLLRQSKLSGRSGAALKWEGIVNDPVGALFAVAAFEIVRVAAGGGSPLAATMWILFAAAFGAAIGMIFGYGIVRAFRAGWTPEYLKAPIIFASVILCYALAEQIEGEIGLVAVTAYGMTLANSRLAGLVELRKFKEDIAVLLVSGVFVILTANLKPNMIADAISWRTLAFLVCMLFIVRPLSVWLSTYGTLTRNEAILLGWIAPRGIVAVAVSGLFGQLLIELDRESDFSFPGAEMISPLAFAMVFATVVLHGFSIGPLARRLKLSSGGKPGVLLIGVNPWSVDFAKALNKAGIDTTLADSNWRRLKPAREAGLETYFGEVLSEEAELRLDHARFDTALALSANEPYNALVSGHFAPELGRHKVFQLSSQDSEEEDPKAISFGTRGRTLIRRGRSYDSLLRDHYRGWVFSSTPLTEKYDLAAFRADRPKSDVIAEIRTDGSVYFIGPNREARGGDGVKLISFGPPEALSEIETKVSIPAQ
ncbi:MAG: sodium:proton antiporter [Pseudomonadota bacterium]